MAHVRDSDTALWLHNKLGSAEELWLPSSISGIIKTTTIDNIYRCFTVLTTTVKLKLLLGVLHLPRRNLEEMKHTIEGIIELALEDSDLWVKLVAGIIKTYPMTFNLNLDLRSSPIAQHVLQQAAEKVKAADTIANLPLECQYVNKTALQSLVGNLPPVKRHFSLLKRPKSAALRTELLHKSDEAVSQLKKGGPGMGSKTVPVKHRDMARRSSDIGPMKRIPTKATMGRPDVTRSMSNTNTPTGHRSLARVSRQQAGGTKLLDISEQPIGGSGISVRDSKRRKKLQQQQDIANTSQQPEEEETEPEKPPEYAAGLPPSIPSSAQPEEVSTQEEVVVSHPPKSTPRWSTTESTEHEFSSEEEKEPEPPVEPVPAVTKPTEPTPRPVVVLPTSPPVTAVSVRLLSPTKTTPPNREQQPAIVYAVPSTLQSPRQEIAQQNKTIYRITSPTGIGVKSPERMTVPFQQVQVIRQMSPVIRQVTPPKSQQQPTGGHTIRSPIMVQKFQTQRTPTPVAPIQTSSANRPIVLQPRTQTSMPMYVPNQLLSNPQIQRIPLAQNITNSPTAVVIRAHQQQQIPSQRLQLLQQAQQLAQQKAHQQAQQQQVQQQVQQVQQQQAQQVQQAQQQQQVLQQQVQQQQAQQQQTRNLTFTPSVRLPQHPQIRLANPTFFQSRALQQQQQKQPPQQPQPAFNKPPMAASAPPKRGLALTREQMYEAQELFKNASNLTRPEKAVIIGFIAGNRENPHPEQGDIIRFVLSETVQNVQNPQSGGVFPVIVETILELNYSTGKLTKVPRFKAAQSIGQPLVNT